ncbi:MAG: carboxypeptidase-like regulatory domain-containing protein [Terriglobales bacterium]
MLNHYSSQRLNAPCRILAAVALLAIAIVIAPNATLFAQTTISTGSIQGTVSDQTGAAVGGAKVTITQKSTGRVINTTTTSSGTYASGALIPGEYMVRVEAPGFKTTDEQVVVQVNTTASANLKLVLGSSTQIVEVQGSEVEVNTEQATVQGVLTERQIENLPINGRNFLDLAQLEPGVQIQDGGTFDPTKNGFSSVSFGGRFGRTARIEVDGVDISDETVGTTTQNLPLGAIQESALQQSSLDLSTELTSSGSVNITTKSGTNGLHGEGFYYFRDQSLNAALPGGSTNYFQRNQFGGDVGGPIIKDKLFFFADLERNKQDLLDPVIPGGDFANSTGSFTSPFRDTEALGRVDGSWGRLKTFYRFTFEQNRSVLPFIPNSFQPFANENHSRNHIVGADFNTGSFTHSIRFGYSKFQNGIKDAVTGTSIFNPGGAIELAIGADPNCLTAGADDFCSGPNFLAPQATFQSDHQIKYDGGKPFKNHIFRFGVGLNHLHGGGYAEFLGLAPAVGSPTLGSGAQPPCSPTCSFPSLTSDPTDFASNPLNYPAVNVTLGNGQGFSSAKPSFGNPGGGLGPDNRFSLYFGDSWKMRRNFTWTAGLRYARDTGRTDSDLGPTPALAAFDNQFYSGLENRVHQPNLNFAPQLGFAWDPRSNEKTVIRGGIGLFYENSIWNNILFDPAGRLQQGLFLGLTPVCSGGKAQPLPFTTTIDPNTICGDNYQIGNVGSQIVTLQQEYQAATKAAGASTNGTYIGSILASGIDIDSVSLLAPNYKSSRSVQMNIGVQREIHRGLVLTADYLRNISTHNLLSIDTNRVGDARYFNLPAAQAAIATTLANCGVTTVVASYTGAGCPTDPANGTNDGGQWTPRPATISDYASNGLDSGYSACGGGPCPNAAFGGINNGATGANQMLFPIGRSVYNGLQMSLKEDVQKPLPGIKYLNFQVSYSLSRYVSTTRDSDFINFPTDNADPLKYVGPNGLDRTHQLSFGGIMDLPAGFRLSIISHFDSPLASNVTLPTGGAPGGIFQTDITGDGTGDGTVTSNGGVGDLLPGTNVGGFGRSFGVNGLNKLITNYNNNLVGTLTPAGKVLLANASSLGITSADLTGLQAVIGGNQNGSGQIGGLQLAPAGAVGQGWLKTFDFGLNWGYKIKETGVEIRPGVTFFNVFNISNFDGPAVPFSATLNGQPGSPNGTLASQPAFLRLGLGSGVNALGSPRVVEFELKLVF